MIVDKQILEDIRDLQLIAQRKGLVLLIGEKFYNTTAPEYGKEEIGFAVVKILGGLCFSIWKDGTLYYDRTSDGPYGYWTVTYHYTLEEAEKIIKEYSFEEHFIDNPKFYGLIRVYENEDFFGGYVFQKKMLDDWALRVGVTFAEIFVCRGGFGNYQGELLGMKDILYEEGADNLVYSCAELFGKLRDNDVLCVTGSDRLDGDEYWWLDSGLGYVINYVSSGCKIKNYKQAPESAELPF